MKLDKKRVLGVRLAEIVKPVLSEHPRSERKLCSKLQCTPFNRDERVSE